MTPPIAFFIPPSLWPNELPTSPDQNWAGYGLGLYTWTIQTALRLQATGTPCQLTDKLPEKGIVLCHSNALRAIDIPHRPRRLLICMKAEAPFCAIAPLHIVQNPLEASVPANRYFIPHWPQPQLIPRDSSRGDRFETLAFFGHKNSLANELNASAWETALAQRNLTWKRVANTNPWHQYKNLDTRWNDYHDVDAIIAVRSFNHWQRRLTYGFKNKPATKLYNAWLSGAIAILGEESAYRHTGRPGQDYAEVRSLENLLDTIDRLKTDVNWRRTLVKNAHHRAAEFTISQIVQTWQTFLEEAAIPAYEQWCRASPKQRQQQLMASRFANYQDRTIDKARRFLSKILTA